MPDGTVMTGPIHGPNQHCIEWAQSGGSINKVITKKQSKQSGGYLVGPSHDDGGIPAIVDGTEPIEVEGGEFIVNKKTVDSLGLDFLHKLNSTSTPYHPPEQGFQEGQLPVPSNYAGGGRVTNKLRTGGKPRRTPPKSTRSGVRTGSNRPKTRSMQGGGNIPHCPPGQTYSGGGCVPAIMNSSPNAGYKMGGTLSKRKKKMKAGGNIPKIGTSVGVSTVGSNHSHTITKEPLTGNGMAHGSTHSHRIRDNIIQMYCDSAGNCHSHN